MNKTIAILGVLLALSLMVSGCGKKDAASGLTGAAVTDTKPAVQEKVPPQPTGKLGVEDIYTIEVSSAGFSPNTLTIKSGDSVKFVAKDGTRHWPASDIHPIHAQYPGSNLNKCNSPEQGQIFDACWSLREGETYEFTFEEKGSWGFHDHLHPALTGKIVVE